jgi:hypothetical protein
VFVVVERNEDRVVMWGDAPCVENATRIYLKCPERKMWRY